jgi:hypothetical protein
VKNKNMANELQYTSVFQKVSFGDYGLRILSSGETSVANEAFAAIQVLADCVVSFTNNTDGGDTTITSLSLNAGQAIYGNFEDISLSSGKLIAYLR